MALDVPDEREARGLVLELCDVVKCFKVGLEMYTALGPRAIELVKSLGGRVFLDLKLHDIPNTVARAAEAAARLGVDLLTVHASGGMAMLEASKEAVLRVSPDTKILAVTLLTSIDATSAREEIGLSDSPEDRVVKWAVMAEKCGVDGVVSSVTDVTNIRKEVKRGFLVVTPGIRPAGHRLHDQKRVGTPSQAIKYGSDVLVVGRPVTEAPKPCLAAQAIVDEIDEALRSTGALTKASDLY